VSIRDQCVLPCMFICDNVAAMFCAVAKSLLACSSLSEHGVCDTQWQQFVCRSLAVMCLSHM